MQGGNTSGPVHMKNIWILRDITGPGCFFSLKFHIIFCIVSVNMLCNLIYIAVTVYLPSYKS